MVFIENKLNLKKLSQKTTTYQPYPITSDGRSEPIHPSILKKPIKSPWSEKQSDLGQLTFICLSEKFGSSQINDSCTRMSWFAKAQQHFHSILLTVKAYDRVRRSWKITHTHTHTQRIANLATFTFSLMLTYAGSQVGVSIQACKKEINAPTHNLGRMDEHVKY